MARARSLKPGFFSNEDLIELPFEFRLLFAGLWTMADRAGRLEDRPKKIKLNIFPGDNVDCEAGLTALASRGFIKRYEANGIRYIQVTNWTKHQSPHVKEAASTIPAPDEHCANTSVAALTPSSLTPDSGLLTADNDNGTRVIVSPAAFEPTPEAKMAKVLRDAGHMKATSIHPTLVAWVKDGFTPERVLECFEQAQRQQPNQAIHPNYVDRILREPTRAPPAAKPKPKGAWDRMMEANGGE